MLEPYRHRSVAGAAAFEGNTVTRHTLLATGVALGAAGLALGAGLLPAQAATSTTPSPSIHVIAPCVGGAGKITLTASKSATGTALHTTVSGVKHTSWTGAAFIKNAPAKENSYTAVNGKFSASATSTAPWPQRAAGAFMSADYSTLCVAAESFNATRAEGASDQTDLVIRRDTKVVRVNGEDLPAGTYSVVVRITTPAGFQKQTKKVTVAKANGSTGGTYSTTFKGFKKVGAFTRAAVTATSANGKHTTSLTFSRIA